MERDTERLHWRLNPPEASQASDASLTHRHCGGGLHLLNETRSHAEDGVGPHVELFHRGLGDRADPSGRLAPPRSFVEILCAQNPSAGLPKIQCPQMVCVPETYGL